MTQQNKSLSLLQLETFGCLINTIYEHLSNKIEIFLEDLGNCLKLILRAKILLSIINYCFLMLPAQFSVKHFKNALVDILNGHTDDENEMTYALITVFQKFVNSALNTGTEFKMAHVAMTIISSLLQHLSKSAHRQVG